MIKKLHLFLLTLAFGFLVTSPRAYKQNFSEASLHNWVLDALFVSAVLGFILYKYLQSKNKLR